MSVHTIPNNTHVGSIQQARVGHKTVKVMDLIYFLNLTEQLTEHHPKYVCTVHMMAKKKVFGYFQGGLWRI